MFLCIANTPIDKNIKAVTSYDLLKTVALLLMVIDHIGAYVFPDEPVLRLIGRMSAPLWLFLIGYARRRDGIFLLFAAGVLVQISDGLFRGEWFSLDILFLFALARYFLDPLMAFMLRNWIGFLVTCLLLLIFLIPSSLLIMYGTAGLGFVIWGYLLRHRRENAFIMRDVLLSYAVFVGVLYYFHCALVFPELQVYTPVLVLEIVAILGISFLFRPCDYRGLDGGLWWLVRKPLQFFGRYSLEFYVVHLWILRATAKYFLS